MYLTQEQRNTLIGEIIVRTQQVARSNQSCCLTLFCRPSNNVAQVNALIQMRHHLEHGYIDQFNALMLEEYGACSEIAKYDFKKENIVKKFPYAAALVSIQKYMDENAVNREQDASAEMIRERIESIVQAKLSPEQKIQNGRINAPEPNISDLSAMISDNLAKIESIDTLVELDYQVGLLLRNIPDYPVTESYGIALKQYSAIYKVHEEIEKSVPVERSVELRHV